MTPARTINEFAGRIIAVIRLNMNRPQHIYRNRLLEEVESLHPERILEVGCGGGEFLRDAKAAGLEVFGIDPDMESVAALSDDGFRVAAGRAEDLRFPDGSFSAVVFSFTAHHIADWNRAIEEALRVSNAICILDPWYETSIPSQAVAEQFDQWCKRIDRASGMIHNDCLSVRELLKPIEKTLAHFQLRITYLLELQELGVARMRELAASQLAKIGSRPGWERSLDELVARARSEGFSDDGAILLSIRRKDR